MKTFADGVSRPAWILGGCIILVGACGKENLGPDAEVRQPVVITVSTVGGDPDEDGYTLIIDGRAQRGLHSTETVRIESMPRGIHQLGLNGIAPNCDLQGEPLRSIDLPSPTRISVTFTVQCFATGIEASNITTGVDWESGYSLRVDDLPPVLLFINSSSAVTRLPPGRHSVALLLPPASNCQASQLVTEVEVLPRTLVPAVFSVTCLARTGNIQVTVTATGVDAGTTGYQIRIDDGPVRQVPVSGTLLVQEVAGGDHRVQLSGTPANCTILGDDSRIAPVLIGGLTRHIAEVTFSASCQEIPRPIAFVRWSWDAPDWGYTPRIATVSETGAGVRALIGGNDPSWTPDGRLLFVRIGTDCYYGCPEEGISLMNRDGTGLVDLTDRGTDRTPRWSPAAARIAFVREGQIWLMNPDGSVLSPLPPLPIQRAADLAWSPDGSRLVFACVVEQGNQDLCVVNADGSGFARLTTDPSVDGSPAWRPDGGKLAFTSRVGAGPLSIALMNPDGTGITQLTLGEHPAWAPDGNRLVFGQDPALYLINADGSGRRQIVAGGTSGRSSNGSPVWRP